MAKSIYALLLCFIYVVSVLSECNLFCSLGREDPGWLDAQGRSTFVWRYNLTNLGDEPVNFITVGVSHWKDSQVINQWNLEDDPSDPLRFIVTNFWILHPGQVWDQGAGFIASGSPFLLPAFPNYTCGPHLE